MSTSSELLISQPSSPDLVRRSLRRQTLRDAARIFRRASSRRMMREPSMMVREAAAEQLEERQSDWAYSRPVVALDIAWNFVFVLVAAVVLFSSRNDLSEVSLRVWVIGYALQCVVHVFCVCFEFRRRRRAQEWQNGNGDYGSQYVSLVPLEDEQGYGSVAKNLESANTMFSFIWWIIGFYWVSVSGEALVHDSPQLYWLCIIFLAFDVFFVVFCVALASVIGIAVCCFLPCIIAILYAVADQEGASIEDIERLSKFKFRTIYNVEKQNGETQGSHGCIMVECGTDSPTERVLLPEDAECCICLSSYNDGVELRQIPCGHHFHCTCVDKWLHINATCPLCKYNILKNSKTHGLDEEV